MWNTVFFDKSFIIQKIAIGFFLVPEKLKMLLDEEKKGLYDALIQKCK